MRREVSDRRAKPRFEIVGELAGTFETVVPLSLLDASAGGVLVDSPVALTVGAQHQVRFHCDGAHAAVHVMVRHVRPTARSGEQRYLIGFEFVAEHPVVRELLERWIVLYGDAAI